MTENDAHLNRVACGWMLTLLVWRCGESIEIDG